MDTRWRNTNIQSYYNKYVRRNWSYDPKIIAPYKYSYSHTYLLTYLLTYYVKTESLWMKENINISNAKC